MQLQVSVLRNVPAHAAHHVFRCFVALDDQFYCLHETLIVELHQIIKLFHLSNNILGKELRKWRLIVAVLLVLHDDQVSVLLQVLDFRSDQILVAFDADDWNAVITHVADNLQYELLELFLLLVLVLLD